MSLDYDHYLQEHIRLVMDGLKWMDEELDLGKDHLSVLSRAIEYAFEHDKSKWSAEEYPAYDNWFYGNDKSHQAKIEFEYAWLHHIHKNRHHWQHWVLINDDDGTVALEMPREYVYEMIADWWTFSWKNGNLYEIFDWYDVHKDKMILHKETRKMIESVLDKMKARLDELKKYKTE